MGALAEVEARILATKDEESLKQVLTGIVREDHAAFPFEQVLRGFFPLPELCVST